MNRRHVLASGLIALTLIASGCTSSQRKTVATRMQSAGTGSSPSGAVSHPTASTTTGVRASTVLHSTAAPVVTNDWSKYVNFAALPHPELDCRNALRGTVEVHGVTPADVTGDGAADALVRISCLASTSAWPDIVEVYSNSSGRPALVGTLLHQSENLLARTVTPSGRTVTLSEATWSRFTALCCPDLTYTQTFTWTGHGFAAGVRHDVLKSCTGVGASLETTAGHTDGAAGHGSVVLTFRNNLPQACTLTGYPGLDASTSAGVVHAERTLSGSAGGSHSITTVRLAPGATASATVEWLNAGPNGASCRFSISVAATPANTESTTTLPVSVSVCGLQVHPTVPGSTGRS